MMEGEDRVGNWSLEGGEKGRLRGYEGEGALEGVEGDMRGWEFLP